MQGVVRGPARVSRRKSLLKRQIGPKTSEYGKYVDTTMV